MNKPGKQIFWHQGLFLQPHHFQQNDLYIQSLFSPHNQFHTPFFWGCRQIRFQETSLSQRTLEVESCDLIFQDGTWVRYPGNTSIEPRSFTDISFDVEKETPVTAYIGIRKWNDFGKNITSTEPSKSVESIDSRGVSSLEPEDVHDVHAGGDPVKIRKINYNLKIFWDHEIDKYNDFLMIPICQLTLQDESVGLSPSYIAPTYDISGSRVLMKILNNIRESIISRCRVFESFKFSQGITSDFDAHFLPHLLVLSSLNRALPAINHIIEIETFHPHTVYSILKQIIGDLSTFTDRINALGQLKDGTPLLPEYRHENLFHCFNEAQILLGELLRGISIGGESIFSMTREGDYFKATLPAEEFRNSYMYFLVLKSTAESDQIINDMNNIVKMGSPQNIENMIARALPGVPVKHRLVPPPGMPKKSGYHYFRIDSKHHLWDEIKQSGNISLFWDNAPEETSIDIVVSQL